MSFRILLEGVEREVDIVRRRPHLVVLIDGRVVTVEDPGVDGDGSDMLVIGGFSMPLARTMTAGGLAMRTGGRTYSAELLAHGEDGGDLASGDVRAPMPGAVVAVDAAVGDQVETGAAIITIESMKLQTILSAARPGFVVEILVAEGEAFAKDQLLARLADEIEGNEDA